MGLLDYMAIYGAIAGTAAIIWKGVDYYKDRINIRVKLLWAYRHIGVPGYTPETSICLEAVNNGRRPVTLSSAGIRLSKNALIPWEIEYDELPRELSEGKNLRLYMRFNELKDALARYCEKKGKIDIKYAFFRDQTDRLYKGKMPKDMKDKLIGDISAEGEMIMETRGQLLKQYTEWTVKYVKAHKRFVSLLPDVELRTEEPTTYVLTPESLEEYEEAEQEVKAALAKLNEIRRKLALVGDK